MGRASDSEESGCSSPATFADTARACVDELPGCRLLLVGDDGPDSYDRAVAAAQPAAATWTPPDYFWLHVRDDGATPGGRARDGDVAERDAQRAGRHVGHPRGDDVYLACSPLYHAANGYAYTAIFQGGTVVVLPRWDAREWLRAVERHRVTVCFMVPAFFIRILELPSDELDRADLSSLRLILHAAAPCPLPVKRQMLDRLPHVDIWEFYGATEGGATRISSADWRTHPGSVGTPWPGVEVLIVDDNGDQVAPGVSGRVFIRPPGDSLPIPQRSGQDRRGLVG